jgi:hypothetical protein
MNILEALARQIRRVSTIRHRDEAIGPNGVFGLTVIDAALERACKVVGSGDPIAIIAAGQELEGIEE